MDFSEQRRALVERLRERQEISGRVAGALLAVPRHLFLPGVAPEDAYRDEAIVTKRDDAGLPTSSSSQPAIMATMLDQLGVEPGQRVLEIGTGTGYNAALLAHLVGPDGHVVSVDLDADVVAQARLNLAAAGASRVEAVCADGAQGHAAAAPYDRLIATVGVWDLAPAWLEQLGAGGRLVAPLDLRGVQASVAFERSGDHWAGRSVAPCGFMRMRGPFAGPEAVVVLRRDPDLLLALPERRDVGDVQAALEAPPAEIAVPEVGPAHIASFSLWLALHEPRWCALSGKLGHGYGMSVGLVEGDGIALLAAEGSHVARGRAATGDGVAAQGHGPGGAGLAAELAGHVRAWDEAGRPDMRDLRVAAYPGHAGRAGGGTVIRKRHTTLVLSFTDA
ncbi:methyltransferase, FxLD system [Nonomuraea sp. NPDC050786]|uniref:methyltransferase, FxLD system n=1 Tax=Nonomuraea sp. NPDC050786 TaxID=3154840 RepID=UPI0033CC8192